MTKVKIYVEASIIVYAKYKKKLATEERELRYKLEPYVVGNGGELIGDVYKVDYMSPEYKEIMKFGEYDD